MGVQLTDVGTWLHPFYYYIQMMPQFLGWAVSILFAGGLALIAMNFKSMNKKHILLLLYTLGFFVMFSLTANKQERFLLNIYPMMIAIGALFLVSVLNFFVKNDKLKNAFIIAIVVVIMFSQASTGITLAQNKASSYVELEQLGTWLKSNTSINDSIISASIPQLSYFAERNVYAPAQNETSFKEQLKELNPRYVILSLYEQNPDYLMNFQSLKYINAIGAVSLKGTNQSIIILFDVNYSAIK
jgi:hypothetical protein